MKRERPFAELVLEDGRRFAGRAFGDVGRGETWGEVVFNTAMTGYGEVISDPSYAGQIVVMTYPLIGNYGIQPEDLQSSGPRVRGLVVRHLTTHASHPRATTDLEELLRSAGVLGLEGVDTRALTRHLRQFGTRRGVIRVGGADERDILRARHVTLAGVVEEVTAPSRYELEGGDGPLVAVVDYGIKTGILSLLRAQGCRVQVFPAHTPAEEILDVRPEGVVLSNGPGDPADMEDLLPAVRTLATSRPTFGICLGHQLLARAFGARTYKLKFGHHGANHPVLDLVRGRVGITSHNHNYAVDEESMAGTGLEVTHRNLNDGTVEGMRHRHLPVRSLQYHPEAAPGPWDEQAVIGEFVADLGKAGG